MADPRISSIVDKSGHAETVAWAHSGAGNLAALPDPELAIAAAAELGNVAALQSVSEPKALRKAAAAALHRLKSRGVKVADAPPPASFTLAREALDVPPKAFLSAPNALGNVHILLTSTDHESSCIMELIVGGDKVQDSHGHASRSELRTFWKDLTKDPTMREVPFLSALHVADALMAGRPAHGWSHFTSKLPSNAVETARATDPLTLTLPASDAPSAGWLLPAWLVPGKVVEAAVAALPGGDPEGGAAPDEGWLDEGCDAALAGDAREAFAVAADRIALIFAIRGEAVSAKEAWDVAGQLRAGDAGRSFSQLRSALLIAAFQEIQRRQDEQRADLDAMMQRIGQQR